MRIQGEHVLPLDPQAAWGLLLDTEVLSRAMPGCQSLVPIGPDEYEIRMKMAISSIRGLFSGKIRIADQNPPSSYRLLIESEGKLGFVRGDGVLTLAANGDSTTVYFSGQVQVGGLVATVGERMLDMTTKMMIKRFFNALAAEAEGVRDAHI
ncbi:MAG: carbon monoxide dehydrogenase subunit G [Acidobacteriales bacterium]|nr:carbon monoxide dehydrogenase subunit G [Terriglobales bacterium]